MMTTNLLIPLGSEIERLRRSIRPSAAGLRQIARTILVEAGDAAYPSDVLWLDPADGGQPRSEVLARSLLAARTVAWMGVHFVEAQAEAEWLVVAALIADAGRLRLDRTILAADDPTHPNIAAALAGGLIDGSASLPRWVRNHHERSDGTGYPAGFTDRGLALEDRLLIAAVRFSEIFEGDAAKAAGRLHEAARRGAFDADLTANLVWSITGELPADAGFNQPAPEPWPLTDFGNRRLRLDPAHPALRGPHFASTTAGVSPRGVSERLASRG
jgi:hypothetical protein